jgi:hypothetical protein
MSQPYGIVVFSLSVLEFGLDFHTYTNTHSHKHTYT